MHSTFAVFTLAATALAASRTEAPEGCITVASSGGDFSSIQQAVNSLSTSSGDDQCIFIAPGAYTEQVLVPARSAQLSIYGSTTDDTSYGSNAATITYGLSQADGLSNDETATLRIKADGFRLYNVNVKNSYGEGSQAVALSAYSDSGFYGCSLEGFQDTLLSNEGAQVYVGTRVIGATDFIFGQRATSWFERVDVRVVAKSIGYVTANGRDSDSNPSYYVFNNCDVSGVDGSVPAGAYYLGRPWRDHARVVFQQTSMSSVINSAGWHIWNTGEENTCCVLFGEYGNTGDGAKGNRADFATMLSSPVSISDVLGGGYDGQAYFDSSFFNGGGAQIA